MKDTVTPSVGRAIKAISMPRVLLDAAITRTNGRFGNFSEYIRALVVADLKAARLLPRVPVTVRPGIGRRQPKNNGGRK
jgi:hypothetical protein